jgi:hypothetical protein
LKIKQALPKCGNINLGGLGFVSYLQLV